MDFNKLSQQPTEVNISGNYSRIWWIDRSWAEKVPGRDINNPHIISDNVILKPGKSWIPLYATNKTTNKEDTGSDQPDNDAVTSVFKMKVPLDIYRREFIAKYGKKQCMLIVHKCGKEYPEMIGDACSIVEMSWKRSEGVNAADENLVEFTFTREGAYIDAEYRGSLLNMNVFPNNSATPSVANGTTFFTANNNTSPLSLTNLTGATVGKQVTIIGGASGPNFTKIENTGNFDLTSSEIILTVGVSITLILRQDGKWLELSRIE